MTPQDSEQLSTEIIHLTRQIAQQPNDVDLLMQLALKLIQVKSFIQAQPILQHALSLAKERADICYNLALVDHQLGKDDLALPLLVGLQQTKFAHDANYLLAIIYFEAKQLSLATVYGLTAVEDCPDGFSENLLLSQILAKQQQWRQAEPYAQVAYQQQPSSADANFALGSCLLNLKQTTRGKKLLNTAAQYDTKQYQQVVDLILNKSSQS